MERRSPLVTLLAQRAHETTVAVAELLTAAEQCLPNGRQVLPGHGSLDATALRDKAKSQFPAVASEVWPVDDDDSTYSSLRLARLVVRAWNAQVHSTRVRPDVLSIVCQFLANPDEPHTYDVVRFAVILALRAEYEIKYDEDVLNNLKNSYDALRLRRVRTSESRIPKRASKYDYFLIDILCLDGRMRRQFSQHSLTRYYESFRAAPFGVIRARPLTVSGEEDAPQLLGELPEFSDLINVAFTQPTVVPGLDAITGGLLGPVAPVSDAPDLLTLLYTEGQHGGGLVSLIGGPPGSGKTSLALMLARRLSELGSVVRYLSTEEDPSALKAKAFTMARPLSRAFRELIPEQEEVSAPDLKWLKRDFETLEDVVNQLETDFERPYPESDQEQLFFLTFPRAVIIDSITALMEIVRPRGTRADLPPRQRRRELARVLSTLREMGLCVILLGSVEDARDAGLAYVVDNVFSLALDATVSARHPVRLFAVEKTRLQRSSRGTHVFHVGGPAGCSVSPSLHSVLKDLKHRPIVSPDRNNVAVFWVPGESEREQGVLNGIVTDPVKPLTIRSRSQVLLYGPGPSGKARLALTVALEPVVPTADLKVLGDQSKKRTRSGEPLRDSEAKGLDNCRILLLSFLYDETYYARHLRELIHLRFGKPMSEIEPRNALQVLHYHPGFVDPETVVGHVRQHLRGGELEGRPFTAVIIDGVHNILMQFPLLENEPLVWSTLNRYFRTLGIMTITTFTFFEVEGWAPAGAITRLSQSPGVDSPFAETISGRNFPGQELFFHLLVSSCDYTYQMKRSNIRDPRSGVDFIRLKEKSSPEPFVSVDMLWNPASGVFRRDG